MLIRLMQSSNKIKKIAVLMTTFLLPLYFLPASAEIMDGTDLQKPNTPVTSLQNKANQWGVSVEEYKTYQDEMANTPSQYWWKDLDPPQVLGMNAKTEGEREKYALIDVQLDHERVSKEIAFQHAYDQAFQTLYPNAKTIDLNTGDNHHRVDSSAQQNDHLYLFIKIQDAQSHFITSQLLQQLRSTNQVLLNIFFVGDTSFEDIQRWAIENNIPRHEFFSNGSRITLNHNEQNGNNMLYQLVDNTKVTLPLVIRVRNQHSEILSVTQLEGASS